MQVEVRIHGIPPVGGHVHRRGEVAEQDAGGHQRIGAQVVHPHLAIGKAVAGGDKEILAVLRDLDAVRAFHFGREFADFPRALDDESAGPKTEAVHLVRRFRADIHPVVGGWLFGDCRRAGRLLRTHT